MKNQAPRRRRRWVQWLRWAIAVAVSLIVLTVVGISLSVHLSTAPAMLTLPKTADSAAEASSGGATADGVWRASSGSVVGWRVEQIVIGQQSPIVGRTGKVWGSITIADGSVTQGSFSVDMAALTSSTSKTTRRTVFDVSAYPMATLTLTSPTELGAIPDDGKVERFSAAADITMHGVSHVVRFSISAEHFGDSIYVLADITFPYGNWNISAQGVPFLADLQSPATIEVLLHLTRGPGNVPSLAAVGRSTAGGSL